MSLGEIVVTADGSHTLRLPGKEECYHSQMGALSEARELYLVASGFLNKIEVLKGPTRLAVLDVGLGLAYNALATLDSWFNAKQAFDLELVSLEYNSALVEQLVSGAAIWSKSWPSRWQTWCQNLSAQSDQIFTTEIMAANGGRAMWTIIVADATQQNFLARHLNSLKFDYVWQDPFSPKENPSMWSENWFATLKEFAVPDVTLVTYSVARMVRDNLAAAGWHPEKMAARSKAKRHWLRATLH